MVHARLGIAAENSGKLVSVVRQKARQLAGEQKNHTVIVDGPPGIGCPVIAAMAGASAVLAVTEPTLAAAHDLERVLRLAHHFNIPAAVCVNKWDINPEMTVQVEDAAERCGAVLAGRIPYDTAFTDAMIQGRTLVEHSQGKAACAVRSLWKSVNVETPGTQPELAVP
jgi:MinD superfamily P-loop ATPase